ncbi:SDR family NAD(P)-dependent oxidoreductase [Quadrisphaera sp. KR29]|uniref:SDR family NAD(P)-dependent oxidoreductase n=1 Tax=Quadrisphaera sp. KR29 TaxID=3461391 RepID=UPI004043AF44
MSRRATSRRWDHEREVVLITGATSGIGAGMAAKFHARGARLVLTGRDSDRLRAVVARHPGATGVVMDVADPASVGAAVQEVADVVPHLTTLVNNAGVQLRLDFAAPEPPEPSAFGAEIATNLTGLVHVTAAALPLLRRAPRARVVMVGSGLGFVPLVQAPVYSATKAAVHSFSTSLRQQLAPVGVQVVEVVPPVVQTSLHRHMPSPPPMAMPLETFLDRTFRGLDAGHPEVAVGLGRLSQVGARVAPGLLLRLVNQRR